MAEDVENNGFRPAPRLVVQALAVDRGGRRVIAGLDFTLDAGEALLITGPNGAGKSTLLRTLIGLVAPASGTIAVAAADPEDVGRHCHYLGHRDGVKTALTLAENLAFWQRHLGRDGGLDPMAALAAVDLAALADLPAAYLSAGQRRRLAIARLLVAHRPIWLLDEPTSALDTASEARLIALMDRHLGAGGAILAATHLPLALAASRRLELRPIPVEEVLPW